MAQIIFAPTKAGDLTNISSQSPASGEHWDKVVSDDASYVYNSSGTYQSDLYGYDPIVRGGRINFVRVTCLYKNNAQGRWSYCTPALKSHATIYYGTESSGDRYTGYYTTYTNWLMNPYTGSLWSWSEVYEAQFGASIKLAAAGGGFIAQLGKVAMTVDYTVENVKIGLIDIGMM